ALPSSRRLAAQLGVDRSTVTQAYAELQAMGWVRSRPGSYTVVQKRGGTGPDPAAPGREIDWRTHVRPEAEWAGRLFRKHPSEAKVRPDAAQPAIGLAQLDPDPRLFPLGTIHRTFSRILGGEEAELFEYGSYQGYPLLRDHLARRMRLHGVAASTDEILVTNGAQQALDLLIRVFGRPGRAVVIEAPTYALIIPLLRLNGVKAVAIPMRAYGMDLDRLERVLRKERAAFVYTMPNFQNPTGITTGHEHRERLLALCRARRVPIVEDGFEEDMKYFGRVDLPIKSMDTGGVVIYVGTFSKALFPGLRVGWIAADRECIIRLTAVKRYTDLTSNHLAQVFMHRFCEDGHYDRHLRRLHRAYRRRLDLTLRTMKAAFPSSVTWTEPPGGYTLWVRMPQRMSRAELEAYLEPYGVVVSAGENYFPGGAPSEYFRLCIARTDEAEIREGVARLGRALSDRFGGAAGRTNGKRKR
ncbi:MAG TPA: PLP-dependent aminotransferase family protein, partial [Acidobacteriota bacterium]|nr:PLP-dependent aminotransferase family protein [Acidobacteriota bacterium]